MANKSLDDMEFELDDLDAKRRVLCRRKEAVDPTDPAAASLLQALNAEITAHAQTYVEGHRRLQQALGEYDHHEQEEYSQALNARRNARNNSKLAAILQRNIDNYNDLSAEQQADWEVIITLLLNLGNAYKPVQGQWY